MNKLLKILSVGTILFTFTGNIGCNSISNLQQEKKAENVAWNGTYWGDSIEKVKNNFTEKLNIFNENDLILGCPTSQREILECKNYYIDNFKIGSYEYKVVFLFFKDQLVRIDISALGDEPAKNFTEIRELLKNKYGEPMNVINKKSQGSFSDTFEWETESSNISLNFHFVIFNLKTTEEMNLRYKPKFFKPIIEGYEKEKDKI